MIDADECVFITPVMSERDFEKLLSELDILPLSHIRLI